jgi:hypothetical protein
MFEDLAYHSYVWYGMVLYRLFFIISIINYRPLLTYHNTGGVFVCGNINFGFHSHEKRKQFRPLLIVRF